MSRHSRPNTPLRIALAVISVLLIVVLMAVTLIYRPSCCMWTRPRWNAPRWVVPSAPGSGRRTARLA